MAKKVNQKYLVMWCNEGLETLINLTQGEKENIVAALLGKKPTWRNPIQFMLIRAQANQQRHYEIYVFESEIPEVSIREFFVSDPQVVVDAIRRVGTKLYSDRKTSKDLIT